MRILVTAAVLLAVVSTALVAVCQHSETRRLQHRVWLLERRRERLERTRHRLESAIEAARTPRRLLSEIDGIPLRPLELPRPADFATPVYEAAGAGSSSDRPALAPPVGFVAGDNFERGGR